MDVFVFRKEMGLLKITELAPPLRTGDAHPAVLVSLAACPECSYPRLASLVLMQIMPGHGNASLAVEVTLWMTVLRRTSTRTPTTAAFKNKCYC